MSLKVMLAVGAFAVALGVAWLRVCDASTRIGGSGRVSAALLVSPEAKRRRRRRSPAKADAVSVGPGLLELDRSRSRRRRPGAERTSGEDDGDVSPRLVVHQSSSGAAGQGRPASQRSPSRRATTQAHRPRLPCRWILQAGPTGAPARLYWITRSSRVSALPDLRLHVDRLSESGCPTPTSATYSAALLLFFVPDCR